MFSKLHHTAVEAVHTKGRLGGGIQRDTTNFTDVSQRENVGNGIRIVPDVTEITEDADLVGVLMPAVREGTQSTVAVTDVGQHGCIIENGNRGL